MHDNSRAENNNRDRKSIGMEETKNNIVKMGGVSYQKPKACQVLGLYIR